MKRARENCLLSGVWGAPEYFLGKAEILFYPHSLWTQLPTILWEVCGLQQHHALVCSALSISSHRRTHYPHPDPIQTMSSLLPARLKFPPPLHSHCSLFMPLVLNTLSVHTSFKIRPRVMDLGRIIYLGRDLRKDCEGVGSGTKKGEKRIKGVLTGRLLLWTSGLSSIGDLLRDWVTWAQKVSYWKARNCHSHWMKIVLEIKTTMRYHFTPVRMASI